MYIYIYIERERDCIDIDFHIAYYHEIPLFPSLKNLPIPSAPAAVWPPAPSAPGATSAGCEGSAPTSDLPGGEATSDKSKPNTIWLFNIAMENPL